MLKQLKIAKAIEIKREQLKDFAAKVADLTKRSEEAQAALTEAKTEEDLELVSAQIEAIETESADLETEKKSVEDEIAQLELELEDVKERAAESTKQKQVREKGEDAGMKSIHKSQVQAMLRSGEYYKNKDVIDFYDQFKNLRAVTGGTLTIPQIVVSRIMDILGDYSTLYPIVDKIRVNGTARVLIDTDTTAATWVEQNAALPVGDVGTIASLDFDGWKVGKVTFVDNFLLQDSIINLDEYVSKKIARAIGLALDIAILNGTGVAGKQPVGIIPSIPAPNRVSVAADAPLVDFLKPLGLIDTGTDQVGDIYAVMRRSTYYAHFLEYSVNVNDDGDVVGKLPNLTRPDLVGIPVVFNNAMAADEVLYGDMEQYLLVEREDIQIDTSEHIRFVEDQMAFRGKGRFDGKPLKVNAFALVTITPAV